MISSSVHISCYIKNLSRFFIADNTYSGFPNTSPHYDE